MAFGNLQEVSYMGVFRSQERGVWWKLKVISQ